MARLILPFALHFFFAFACVRVQTLEEGYVTAEISSRGLDFLKDFLVEKTESSFAQLEIPTIEKHAKFPIIGSAHVVLSNITIERVHLTSSTVQTGDSGIAINVSGATANLTMNWKYSYNTWLLPIKVSDEGTAAVQVEGLEVGFSFSLKTLQGSLNLSLLECWCYVSDISIKLDGGASWLYQGVSENCTCQTCKLMAAY